jgi:hypothetical protein
MSETIKSTYGVFNRIVNTPTHGKYDNFINELVTNPTIELTKFVDDYKNRLNIIRDDLSILSKLETIIIQLRSKNLQPSDIKLSFVRDYIYARTFFYREDKKSHDIRVLVGLKEIYGDNIDVLSNDNNFMQLAIEKLTPAITSEIEKSITDFNNYIKKLEATLQ